MRIRLAVMAAMLAGVVLAIPAGRARGAAPESTCPCAHQAVPVASTTLRLSPGVTLPTLTPSALRTIERRSVFELRLHWVGHVTRISENAGAETAAQHASIGGAGATLLAGSLVLVETVDTAAPVHAGHLYWLIAVSPRTRLVSVAYFDVFVDARTGKVAHVLYGGDVRTGVNPIQGKALQRLLGGMDLRTLGIPLLLEPVPHTGSSPGPAITRAIAHLPRVPHPVPASIAVRRVVLARVWGLGESSLQDWPVEWVVAVPTYVYAGQTRTLAYQVSFISPRGRPLSTACCAGAGVR